MKINIKKNNKTKTFNLIKSWDDVTLEKWIELIKLEESGNTKEALETIKALSDIPSNLILKLALKDVAKIMERVTALQNEADSGLKRIIKVEGKEYGYHPDLSEITLGEVRSSLVFFWLFVKKCLPLIPLSLMETLTETRKQLEMSLSQKGGGTLD